MVTNPPVISISLVLAALSSIAEAAPGATPLELRSTEASADYSIAIRQAISSRPAMELVGREALSLGKGLTLDGKALSFDPAMAVVAQTDDSTSAGVNCYANCYSNCYSVCHSSRGWR